MPQGCLLTMTLRKDSLKIRGATSLNFAPGGRCLAQQGVVLFDSAALHMFLAHAGYVRGPQPPGPNA